MNAYMNIDNDDNFSISFSTNCRNHNETYGFCMRGDACLRMAKDLCEILDVDVYDIEFAMDPLDVRSQSQLCHIGALIECVDNVIDNLDLVHHFWKNLDDLDVEMSMITFKDRRNGRTVFTISCIDGYIVISDSVSAGRANKILSTIEDYITTNMI